MTLRFSEHGPEFSGDLVDSLMAGEVVLLCGAGVSAPQMPGFERLVDEVYEALGVERPESERSIRPEENLGSLARRLSDPSAVTRAVSERLAAPDCPVLDQHQTVLRLSRDLDNRISVVTTNFDTLLERAALQASPAEDSLVEISFAGQDLPAPGSPSFSGIIHLHGRLEDHTLGLQPTPLVMTSADYGDAYMRSGWASRFLFDLARCKTIVLVGYAGGDAPVRYFLNLLESDRERFPELKPVYAFGDYKRDEKEAVESWGTLPVTLLPYCNVNPESRATDHSPLWEDLAKLAEIVERPQELRQERTKSILIRSAAEADGGVLSELQWLVGDREDFWPTALASIDDPAWFGVFQDSGLWSDEIASWMIAEWIARNLRDAQRFECACDWQRVLGRPLTERIERHLRHSTDLDDFWIRAWRFFCLVPAPVRDNPVYYATQQRLESSVVLDSDLVEAVGLLAPSLELQRSYREPGDSAGDADTPRLGDIAWPRVEIADPYGAFEILGALCAKPDRSGRILALATAELRSVLELEVEVGLITEDYDVNDSDVPSIDDHEQNRHREGVIFLVRLLVECLSRIASSDSGRARTVAREWKELPGRLGMRMYLHAMQSPLLFKADEAVSALLALSKTDFWLIRREVALLLKERAGAGNPDLVVEVTERVCQTAEDYYARFSVVAGEPDWREHARDAAVWLRLKMLESAGVLGEIGAAELASIKARRSHLDREPEDRDLFWSYVSGSEVVDGDPAPISEAPDGDRLRVAGELAHAADPRAREGWAAFCRSDPEGALDSLCTEEPSPTNGNLWEQYLNALAIGDAATKAPRSDLAVRALEHLDGVEAGELAPMVSGLSNTLRFAWQEMKSVDAWLEKLWTLVSEMPSDAVDLSADLHERAINSAPGKLVETLLLAMDARRRGSVGPADSHRQLARRISMVPGSVGQLGCAVLAFDVAFLLAFDPDAVDVLVPRIGAADAEGAALRAVMLRGGSLTPEVSRTLRCAAIRGAVEMRSNRACVSVAAKLLRPALAAMRKDESFDWGIRAADVAHVLRNGAPEMREGALAAMADWVKGSTLPAEEMWRSSIGPLFDAVWPKERKLRDSSCTRRLIDLAVRTGDAFPAALATLKPYFAPIDGEISGLNAIASSGVASKFPFETLALLWLVCGPVSRGKFIGMANVIDELVAADPEIEVDRRLQWLLLHAESFN